MKMRHSLRVVFGALGLREWCCVWRLGRLPEKRAGWLVTRVVLGG